MYSKLFDSTFYGSLCVLHFVGGSAIPTSLYFLNVLNKKLQTFVGNKNSFLSFYCEA